MGQSGDRDQGWTANEVEARLVAAFRALPCHPVYSGSGGALVTGNPEASEAIGWARRYVPDRTERLILLTWARCRATLSSFATVCLEMDWSRSTAEERRRRAAAAIAVALSAGDDDKVA